MAVVVVVTRGAALWLVDFLCRRWRSIERGTQEERLEWVDSVVTVIG